MDLISLAVPFFLFAIVLEWWVDRRHGGQFFRFNDAIGSLATGAYNSTTGIFTKLVGIGIYAWILEHWAWWRMPADWFDFSPQGLLAWLGVLLLWDFFYFWKHRFGHEVSIFWAAHSVHHQSEEYNLTTALRQTSTDFLVGWVVYLPMFFMGVPLHVFATVSALDLIYQFWVHTRHVDRLGWADFVFVTPSNHRVHHAQNERYIDKNYGGILIIWDRLFGTFEPEHSEDPVVFGVRKPLRSFNPINANLHVYRRLWRDSLATTGIVNRLRVWFGRTGWRPDDVMQADPLLLRPLSEFEPYTGAGPGRLKGYVACQFGLAIVLTLVVGAIAGSGGLLPALLPALALWWLLANLGALCDGRVWARQSEWLRLAMSIPLAALSAWMVAPDVLVLAAVLAALYVAVSATVLFRDGASADISASGYV